MASKIKVLVTGPVDGSFAALNAKLDSLQKSKAGPFHVCFCVGRFFSSNNDEDGKKSDEQVEKLLRDGVPIPVYFCDVGDVPSGHTDLSKLLLGSGHADKVKVEDDAEIELDDDDDDDDDGDNSKQQTKDSNDGETDDGEKQQEGLVKIAPNLYHLCGTGTTVNCQTADILSLFIPTEDSHDNHLTVAFLPPNARIATSQTLPLETKTRHPSYVGCDILLSSEWGQGMATSTCLTDMDRSKLLESSSSDSTTSATILNEMGSYDVAEIASQTRPRYHFSPASLPNGIISDNGNADGDGLFFTQSLPYSNPPSASASGLVKKYHLSRFLALCPVTATIAKTKEEKAKAKAKKFIHALGIQPLISMDRETATAVPEGAVVSPSPYTDDGYLKDHHHSNKKTKTSMSTSTAELVMGNVGLSEAQTRRILLEETSGNQYRWNVRNPNQKRPLETIAQQQQQNMAAAGDPNNRSLFLHGLHKDVTGGINLNKDAILNAFQCHGCMRVRYPGAGGRGNINNNNRPKSFCFLDFSTHQEAAACLAKTGGEIVIAGVHLTLKWSSGTGNDNRSNVSSFAATIPPPPPPGATGIIPPPPPPIKQKRERLTEAEAVDSSSLFLHLPSKGIAPEQCSQVIQEVGKLAQQMLEDAINNDGTTNKSATGDDGAEENDKITAEQEPALKVSARQLGSKHNCGFLDFASHAAASMALATLTGSTDGGTLNVEGGDVPVAATSHNELLQFAQLWWAKKRIPKEKDQQRDDTTGGNGGNPRFRKNHFPPDARTDCWFCLASPTCEKHLIISVLDSCYITMPKGPVNEYHALIVPVNHTATLLGNSNQLQKAQVGAFIDPNPKNVAEIEMAKDKLRTHASEVLQKDLFVFERAISTRGGYHAHINCIPIERGLGSKIRTTLLSMSRCHDGFELRELQNNELSLQTVLNSSDEDGDLEGYFYAEVPVGNSNDNDIKRFLYKAIKASNGSGEKKENGESSHRGPIVPLQFGREVLASVLGNKEVGHWKACVLSYEKEDELAQSYRTSFSKYE